MDFKEFVKAVYSRKAGVAVLAITALTYIAVKLIGQAEVTADVGTHDLAAIKWVITLIVGAIWLIAVEGIGAQWHIDYKHGRQPKEEEPASPENPDTESTEEGGG